MEIGVSGQYEIYKNGELVGKTDNMILDGYFTRFCAGNTGRYGFLYLGSGSTAPQATDVGLETFVVASDSLGSPSNNTEGTGNDMTKFFVWSKSFSAASFAHAALSEVGFRMHDTTTDQSTTATDIDSRALIRDINGNPTTINKTLDDTLVITFKFKMKLPSSPISSEVIIGGNKHTMTLEVIGANSNLAWDGTDSILTMDHTSSDYLTTTSAFMSSSQELRNDITLDGAGGNVTSIMSRSVASAGNTQTVDLWWNFSQTQMSNGIKYISLGTTYNYRCTHALHFDPPLTDVVGRVVRIQYKVTAVRGQEYVGGYQSALTAMSLPATITEIDIPVGAFTSRGRAVATPIGGKAPYTYAWARNGAAGTPALAADSPTSASTTFSATGASLNSSSETWRCTITDDNGDTATADTVVDLTWAA